MFSGIPAFGSLVSIAALIQTFFAVFELSVYFTLKVDHHFIPKVCHLINHASLFDFS